MFSLNMAVTCNSTRDRDTAQLSPGVGWGAGGAGCGWLGERPARGLTLHLQVERKAGGRKVCGHFLFAVSVASRSLILDIVGGMNQEWFPSTGYLNPVPSVLTFCLGTRRTPKSTHCLQPLSVPFLGVPQDHCLNSIGIQ